MKSMILVWLYWDSLTPIKIDWNFTSPEILWQTVGKHIAHDEKIIPIPFNAEETKNRLQKARQNQKKYFDKNAHDLKELK